MKILGVFLSDVFIGAFPEERSRFACTNWSLMARISAGPGKGGL